MEKNNSKQIVLSIVAVLVLVIAVVGVSFAMYQFAATGSKTASISTATLAMAFSGDSAKTLTNTYPMTDSHAYGDATITNWDFSIQPTNPGNATIYYKLWFTLSGAANRLDLDDIRYILTDANGLAIAGYGSCDDPNAATTDATCTGTWTTVSRRVGQYASAENPFAVGFVSNATAVDFHLKAWVDDAYDLADGVVGSGTTTTAGSVSFTVNMAATTAGAYADVAAPDGN